MSNVFQLFRKEKSDNPSNNIAGMAIDVADAIVKVPNWNAR
jgi:hypothetical protein